MQSPQKIRNHLDELLGPPGADEGPLELTLRTMARLGGPVLRGILPEEPADVDHVLEEVALTALRIRSDGVALSDDFLRGLTQIVQDAQEHPAPEVQGNTFTGQPVGAIAAPTAPQPAPEAAPEPVAAPQAPESAPEPPAAPQAPQAAPETAPAPPASPETAPPPPSAPWAGGIH